MEFQILKTNYAVSHTSERAFIFACKQGDIGMVNKVIENININCFNGKALHAIIENNCGPNSQTIFVKLLQHPNIEPNLADLTGTTALHSAMRQNHHSAVAHLLLHPRLDVNVKNEDGDTPAMVGINYCSVDSLELLLADARVKLDEDFEYSFGCIVIADVVEQRWEDVRELQEKMKLVIENAKKGKQKSDLTVLLKEIREESDVKSDKPMDIDVVKIETRSDRANRKVYSKNGKKVLNNKKPLEDDKPAVKLLKNGTISCFVCDDILEIGELKSHLEYKHPKASFECVNCPIRFKNMDINKMSGHMKRVHNLIASEADDVDLLVKKELILLPENLTYVKCQLCKPNKVLVARDQEMLRSHVLSTHKNVSAELQNICKTDKYFKFFCRICCQYKKGLFTKTMTSLNALHDHIDNEHGYGKQSKRNSYVNKAENILQLNYNSNRLSNEPKALKRKSTNSDGIAWNKSKNKKPHWDHNISLENNRCSQSQMQMDQNVRLNNFLDWRVRRSQNMQQHQTRSHKDQDMRSMRDKDARPLQDLNTRSNWDYDARTPQLSSDKKSWRDYDARTRQLGSNEKSWRDHDARTPQLSSDEKSWMDYDARTHQLTSDKRSWRDYNDARTLQGSIVKKSKGDFHSRSSLCTMPIACNESKTPQMDSYSLERDYDARAPHKNFNIRSQRDFDARTRLRIQDTRSETNYGRTPGRISKKTVIPSLL